MDQDHLGSIVLDELTTLFAYRVRHDYLGSVAFHCSDKSKANALITAGGLDDNCIFLYKTGLLRFIYHIEGSSCLN